MLGAPDCRGDARSGRPAQLDCRGAHPAGAPVHEQALAGTQAGLGEDRVVGGGEHLGQAAGLGPAEPFGHRHRRPLVHDRQLRLATASHDCHHAVALGEARRVGAERGHLARQLEARDVWRRAGRGRVGAAPLQHVGPVETGAAHPHEQLAGPGLRVRALLDHKVAVTDD